MSETLSDSTAIQQSTTTEYKNNNLTAKVETHPGCIVSVHATISPLASQAAYAKAIKNVSKEVVLPGFRKGKAPADSVVKKYGSAIEKEWRNVLTHTALLETLDLIPFTPRNNQSVTDVKLAKSSRDEDSELSFKINHTPIVPQIDIASITVEKSDIAPITDEDIAEELRELQLREATWTPVEGRAAKEGDTVALTIVSPEEGETVLCQGERFELNPKKTSAWLLKQLIGVTPGQTIEGHNEAPEGIPSEEEFKPTLFRITLESILEPVLPELNDEFAVSVKASSLEDLKSKAKLKLENDREQLRDDALQSQVIKQLIEKYPFDVSLDDANYERDLQLARLEKTISNDALSPTQKVQVIQQMQFYIENLPNKYRLIHMLPQLTKALDIKVTQKELVDEINHHLMLSRFIPTTTIDESMDRKTAEIIVYNDLILHKTIKAIIEKANGPK